MTESPNIFDQRIKSSVSYSLYLFISSITIFGFAYAGVYLGVLSVGIARYAAGLSIFPMALSALIFIFRVFLPLCGGLAYRKILSSDQRKEIDGNPLLRYLLNIN